MSNISNLQVKFGKRLRVIRRFRDFTQDQLAEKVGCSTEYISRVERGLASPSFRFIEQVAFCLNVDPKDLFDFSDKPLV